MEFRRVLFRSAAWTRVAIVKAALVDTVQSVRVEAVNPDRPARREDLPAAFFVSSGIVHLVACGLAGRRRLLQLCQQRLGCLLAVAVLEDEGRGLPSSHGVKATLAAFNALGRAMRFAA